jgi:hypothetical protein
MRRAVLAVCVITCPIGGCDYRGRSLGPDGIGAPDAAPDARGDGVATCGKPGAIVDDFADGVTGRQWRVQSTTYGDVYEASGALIVTPGPGPAGYVAIGAVDLRDAAIEVEVQAMLQDGAASFAAGNRGMSIALTLRDGQLVARIDKSGGPASYEVPYDPEAHRWWRISDAGGTVALSTSADGAQWAPILTGTGVPYTPAVAVSLSGDGTGTDGGIGTVTFRNLRATEHGAAVGPAPWCKAATFSDEFEGNALGLAWSASGNPAATCDPRVAGNKLHVDQPGVACAGYVRSAALYDLTDSAVVLDVDPIGDVPYSAGALLGIDDATGARTSIIATNYQLCGLIGDYDYVCTTYTGQRYWRLRGDAGGLVWESSPDRVDWTQVRAQLAPVDLARVRISIGSFQSYDGQPAMNFASPGLNP